MKKPKTIKTFLLNGEPTGLRIVEMSNWTGKAFIIPRNKLKDVLERDELKSQAIYFLIGESESGKQRVYIGEAENFKKRAQQHNQGKDFWNMAVCFIAKDDNLTKAHVKYLEAELIKEINVAKRVEVENGNGGAVPKLPESDEADMKEFLENLRIILASSGFMFLEDVSIKNEANEEIYFTKRKTAKGTIKLTNEGYVVQAGSIALGWDVDSITPSISKMRWTILNSDKAKKLENGDYEVLENIIFSSPSYAAAFVIGRNVNGWTELKNKDGKTLDELKRK